MNPFSPLDDRPIVSTEIGPLMLFVRHHQLVPSPGATMRPYAIQRLNNYTFSARLNASTN
ncbi:MAG: hypothetical protein ACK5JU_06840 [Bacteroidales bacterium]